MTMHHTLIALGSNYLPAPHIQWACERIATFLHDVTMSRRLWTKDTKGTGIWYQNCLITGYTDITADELQTLLKEIETETGRTKLCITLDLDLMLYDDKRYHLRDWERPYFTTLFAELPHIAE